MARRTISLPDQTDELVRRMAHEGESFFAAVARLIEAGAKSLEGRRSVSYLGPMGWQPHWCLSWALAS